MKPIDYFIIAVIALIVVAIAIYIIRKKLKGEKIGCGCGCQSCPHAGACGGGKTSEENAENNGTCEKCREKHTEESGEKENDKTV
ncbi:MAG: hypothetical protein IJ373_06995 [Clostridia bacterium]|nr:hypothetical protein [Clostridia bacterium]MBQ8446390.1 hypothetical protein [Clostridia bacterium]